MKISRVLMDIGRGRMPDHETLNDHASRMAHPEPGSHKVARILYQSIVR